MIEEVLGEICHRLPARTLVVAGVALPACARCSGVYLGVLMTAAFYLVPGRRRLFLVFPSRGGAALAALAVIASVIDFALAWAGSSSAAGNEARFAISLFAGWGVWVLLAGLAAGARWGFTSERRLPLGGLAGSPATLLVPGVLLATPHAVAARLLGAGTLLGAAATYALCTYLPLAVLLRRRRLGRAARAALLLGVAGLAVAEITWGYRAYEAATALLRR